MMGVLSSERRQVSHVFVMLLQASLWPDFQSTFWHSTLQYDTNLHAPQRVVAGLWQMLQGSGGRPPLQVRHRERPFFFSCAFVKLTCKNPQECAWVGVWV